MVVSDASPLINLARVDHFDLLAAFYSQVVSAYHLEAGGRALDDFELLSYNAPAALAHLQKAIEWQPDNAQVYRLLARVYRAQATRSLTLRVKG